MTYLQESDLVGERHFIKRPKCKQQQRPITEDLTRSWPEAQRTSLCFMLPPSTCPCFLFPASGVGSLSVAARCFPLIAPAASECCQSFLPFSSSFSHHPYRPDNTYHFSPSFTASPSYLPYSSYLSSSLPLYPLIVLILFILPIVKCEIHFYLRDSTTAVQM